MPTRDLSCGHCGFRGPIVEKGEVLLTEYADGDWDRGAPLIREAAIVYYCVVCDGTTVWKQSASDDFGGIFTERRLFPTTRDNQAIPEKVRIRFDAARKVKVAEPGLYAVGVRRMLETVCNEEGATGKDLFAKLDDLAHMGRIPTTLAEAAHQLRKLGNLGAHDSEVDVEPADVPVIADLAEALLEYLYRAPAQLAAVQAGLAEREKTAAKAKKKATRKKAPKHS